MKKVLFLCKIAIPTWQNRGCVYNYIYLRVVKMPSNTVRNAW